MRTRTRQEKDFGRLYLGQPSAHATGLENWFRVTHPCGFSRVSDAFLASEDLLLISLQRRVPCHTPDPLDPHDSSPPVGIAAAYSIIDPVAPVALKQMTDNTPRNYGVQLSTARLTLAGYQA